ncbi:high-temperature-induced dauer-formation protein-domain-containing protein [Abortiporus biennis]|nr:high-temperature-induced dauer-formation protein-domain-containing protein [Abortiporus biennis]
MFSKLPQKITVPFNILGDEAKLAFRSQAGGIAKLATTRNIPETDQYWNQYFELFDSASDVFSLISPNDVRRALYEAPENVATLIKVVTSRLFNLVSDHTFPTPPSASVASFATSFIHRSGSYERSTTKEVLNCIRILQRILPVVFEIESESGTFEMEVLWKKEVVEEEHVVEEQTHNPQFVIEDEDDDDDEPGQPKQPSIRNTAKTAATRTLPSIAERLFSCLVDLLFCCGFTLPSKIQVDHYKINYTIWEKGVGSTVDPGPSQAYEGNKTEVLRLLLVLLSKQIYAPPSALFISPSTYTLHFVQNTPRRDVLTLLCSLINTAMNSVHGPNANLIGGVATKLPYNHLVFKGEDSRANLVSICFQVLCVLLDFQSGSARDATTTHGENVYSAPTARTNAFRYFVAKLHRVNDFALILDGVMTIFEDQMSSVNNLLPGSKKSVPYIVEAVIFLWKMIELNKKFRIYVLESEKAPDVLAYLLCYGLDMKDKPEQHGMCRVVSYIIQTLSAERAFGQKICSPIKVQVPQKWSSLGNAGDFMINAIYNMTVSATGVPTSRYPAFMIALSNASPYLKNLSVTSSSRLLHLFSAFSNPSFLLSEEGNPRLLFFILESFNNVILRNLSENPNLVYGILRAHKAFEDLGTFTLARGLREIRRAQIAKEERQQGNGVDKGKRRADNDDIEAAHDEKARMLRSENNSLDLPRNTDSVDNLPEVHPMKSSQEDVDSITQPLMSPGNADMVFTPHAPSEKARGKMRAGRSLSIEMTGSLERLAISGGVGRNGFIPTQEWVTSWQQGLPLDNILIVCSELWPKIQDLQASRSATSANTAIIDFLHSVNLEHLLPKPSALAPRRHNFTDASVVWLTSLIWGEAYVRNMTPLGIWNTTSVRLFYVKHTQAQQRQLTDTVSNVVGGVRGLLSRTDSSQSLRTRS